MSTSTDEDSPIPSTKFRVAKAILNYAQTLAATTWCSICHSLDPGGPLLKRKVYLRSPASGARTQSESTDFDLRDQWGPGRVALVDRTLDEIRRNGESCPLCNLIIRACAALDLNVPDGEANIWLEASQNPKITIWGPKNEATSFELFTSEAEPPPSSWPKVLYPLKPVSSNAATDQTLPFVQSHLSRCLSTHKECPTTRTFMPARLLQLSDNGCRLSLARDLDSQPYIALSYCWGRVAANKIFRTLRENLDENMIFIPTDSLPLAIQDAVKLTQLLNIPYIWIDALCIIQDDTADWEHHVAEMGIIYRHAHLVIASGSSSNSNESFLAKPDRPAPVGLDFTLTGGEPGRVFCRRIQGTGMHENYEGMYGGCDPLDSRGWTLQERILATRVVIFSSTELQWICKGSRTCEAGDAGHGDSNQQDLSIYRLASAPETYAFWHRLVKEYSRRYLSYASDKLSALAGIASIAASLIDGGGNPSVYLAGLWQGNLVRDLCWERHLWEIVPWRATKEWRAPSFSWASVEGNVLYNDEGLSGGKGVYLTELLDSSCQPKSLTNPFGGVVDGFVRLRGPLKACRIRVHPRASPGFIWSHVLDVAGTPWKVEFRADVALGKASALGNPEEPESDGHWPEGEEEPDFTAARAKSDGEEGESEPLSGESAWLLLVGFWHQQYKSHVEDTDMWISCIILGRSTRRAGVFERLGFVNTHWPPWGSNFPHKEYLDLIPFIWGEGGKSEIVIV